MSSAATPTGRLAGKNAIITGAAGYVLRHVAAQLN